MVIGIGNDLAEIARVDGAWRRHGERFLDRVFTPAEQAEAARRTRPAEHLAGRFAAKEAVLKALGTGWGGGLGWREVEVRNDGGPPACTLSGAARARAEALGGRRVLLSISHTADLAMATAILTTD